MSRSKNTPRTKAKDARVSFNWTSSILGALAVVILAGVSFLAVKTEMHKR